MKSIISDLYDYFCENTPPLRDNPEYQRAVKAYMEIETEVKEKIGSDLLSKYQSAESAVSRQCEIAVFSRALRLGHGFMIELLGG